MPKSQPDSKSRPSSSKKQGPSGGSSGSMKQQKIESYFSQACPVSWVPEKSESEAVALNDEQRTVLGAVVDGGKNIFFTGAAGTGKSLLLRAIIAAFKKKYAKQPSVVSVTASTGMAASNIGGMTVHSWGAVAPGQNDIEKQIKNIRSCKPALNRWKTTKVLVIDEVSMVDGHLFDLLSSIGRHLRGGAERPFGGIQLVVTGDFFQLPPVTKSSAEPFFAFESLGWKECIDRTVTLTHVFRQKDHNFVGLLNSLRMGVPSPAAVTMFSRLSRPLPIIDGIDPTELFPLRYDVYSANKIRLDALETGLQTYASQDSGTATKETREKILENMAAEQTLQIKVGAQVMLIKNVDGKLVNGSIGRVLGFYAASRICGSTGEITSKGGAGFIRGVLLEGDRKTPVEKNVTEREDGGSGAKLRHSSGTGGSTQVFPLVEFQTVQGKEVVLVGRDEFKVEDDKGNVAARRVQVPLVLAWAMTIHKSQGQTLQYVKIDLAKVFERGQSYVALSRASSLKGLQVLNFDFSKVKAHQKVIDWFRMLQMQAEEGPKTSKRSS